MKMIAIGAAWYTVTADLREEQWTAQALHAESGERFGIECVGATASEAIDGLTRWLTWQNEHANAMRTLQEAQQVYHRTVAASAFGSERGSPAVDLQRESLEQVEAARVRLDEVRARRPN
jgi:hypothetical protein